LSLRNGEMQYFELKDNLGQTTIITFKNSHYNQAIDAEYFRFTVPTGVDILEEYE